MARKPGTLTAGSVQHQISQMAVGEVKWIETTSDSYAQTEREWLLPQARRVEALRNVKLSVSVYTAIGHKTVGAAPVMLIRVQREE